MKRKTHIVRIVLMSLFVITISNTVGGAQQELEWKAKVGECKTYKFTKYFDYTDNDGDGDKHTATFKVRDENGKEVNIIWEEGTIYTIEITRLDDEAWYKKTYGDITTEEGRGTGLVRKTVDNKTYWEEYAESISGTSSLGGVGGDVIIPDVEAYIDGNLFVVETSYEVMNITDEDIEKRNWKTGWRVYSFSKIYNETDTIFEEEYSNISYFTSVEETSTTKTTTTTRDNSTMLSLTTQTSETSETAQFHQSVLAIVLPFLIVVFRKKRTKNQYL